MKDEMINLIHVYQQITASFTIRGSFIKVNLVKEAREIDFSQKILLRQENSSYCETENQNTNMDQLSKRRQSRQFWLIHNYFLRRCKVQRAITEQKFSRL
jgi:hypothetical protein